MADILPFATRRPKRTRAKGERVGEIVMFTGVRVEYHEQPPTPPKHRQRRGKRNGEDGALSA